jgi:predicted phage terminase large subunit-like protein
MTEPIWTTRSLYEDANTLASRAREPLAVSHFWAVADRDLAGAAPKTKEGLIERAKNYVKLDRCMATAPGGPGSNPAVDAAIRRMMVFDANVERIGALPTQEQQVDELLMLMCRTNLMFLGREIFNRDFVFETHEPVCDFFVQKDMSRKFYELDEFKERLLLYPRGSFKSTIDIVDCVQWFINYPDIRILILTAEVGLATEFIGELKNYFFVAPSAPLTIFQQLFPEWTLNVKTIGAEDQFFCPRRVTGDEAKRDPSAWASSILSNLPGRHCDLMKCDDVVNDKNSETPQLVAKVNKKVNYAASLIDPGGHKDFLGTPYAVADLYAKTEEKALPGELKLLKMPARWLLPTSQFKEEVDCGPADYKLLFELDKNGREKLTHKFLDKKKRTDLPVYLSQYMLSASGIKKVKFTLELLMRQTISMDQIPHQLRYYILWDFAYAANSDNDYSVGAVVGLDIENRAFVVEIFRDRYTDNDLAQEIVNSYMKYRPRMVCIENSNGAQFLEQTIRRYADEAGISYIPLDFFKVDNTPNAKASRVGVLQPALVRGELFFSNLIECLEDLYKEFKDFGSMIHNDIPDAISHYTRILPLRTEVSDSPQTRARAAAFAKALRDKAFYEMIFGRDDDAPPVVEEPIVPESGTGDTADEELWDPYGIPRLK